MGTNRQRAIALKAADARILLNQSLPFVYKQMTPAEIEHVQNVLDAAVVNPEINKEANAIFAKSPRGMVGNIMVRDERLVNRAYRLNATQIPNSESDRHIRLHFQRLLTANALTPTTDNPDEATYLKKVENALNASGVWLRIGQPLVRSADDPSRHMLDPRTFEVWLSLGYNGDAFTTKDGQLDRDAILSNTRLGAGYYDQVYQGHAQQSLEKEIRRLNSDIEDGMEEHYRLIKRKRDAAPLVAEISDFAGGADLPDRSIWDYPNKMLLKARQMNVGGNVTLARPFLVVAAIATRNNAKLLVTYADKSSAGAGSAITLLKVVKTAGQVAEVGLTLTGVGGLLKGGVRLAAGEAGINEAAEKMVVEIIKDNPEIAEDLNKVRWVPQPKGSISGNIRPGHSSGAGQGWHIL